MIAYLDHVCTYNWNLPVFWSCCERKRYTTQKHVTMWFITQHRVRINGRNSILGCLLGTKIQVNPLVWEAHSLSWRYPDHLSCSISSGLLSCGGLPHNAVSKMRFLGKTMLGGEYTVLRPPSPWDLSPMECPLCSWAACLCGWVNAHHGTFQLSSSLFWFPLSYNVADLFHFLIYLPVPSLNFIPLPSSTSYSSGGGVTCATACEGQWTMCRSWFSSSTIWVQGWNSGVRLGSRSLHLLHHLSHWLQSRSPGWVRTCDPCLHLFSVSF